MKTVERDPVGLRVSWVRTPRLVPATLICPDGMLTPDKPPYGVFEREAELPPRVLPGDRLPELAFEMVVTVASSVKDACRVDASRLGVGKEGTVIPAAGDHSE